MPGWSEEVAETILEVLTQTCIGVLLVCCVVYFQVQVKWVKSEGVYCDG